MIGKNAKYYKCATALSRVGFGAVMVLCTHLNMAHAQNTTFGQDIDLTGADLDNLSNDPANNAQTDPNNTNNTDSVNGLNAPTSVGANDPNNAFRRLAPIGGIAGVDQGTRIIEADRYAAEGIKLGNFIFRPSIEIGAGINNSRTKVTEATGGAVINQDQTSFSNDNALQLLINSDWSKNAFDAQLNSNVPIGFSGTTEAIAYDANANLRLDLSQTTTLTLGGRYGLSTQTPRSAAFIEATDPATNPGVSGFGSSKVQTYGGTATLEHNVGPLSAQITASIERLTYGAARLNNTVLNTNTASVSQSDLDATNFDVAFRGGFAASAVLSPFVEVSYGELKTDNALDSAGVNRNARRNGVQVGTAINMGEKLSGEIAVGYVRETLEDASLEAIEGVTVNAGLNWSPIRGTNITLNANTATQSSGRVDDSGSLIYGTELGVTQTITSQLSANATLGLNYEQVTGLEADAATLRGQIGMTYNINQYLGLTGRLSREQTLSIDPLKRTTTNSIFVGVRLQR